MTNRRTASELITNEVAAWPGVEVDTGEYGEIAFKVRGREIGHVHGDHAAHFNFPRQVWDELRAQGRIVPHPVFPHSRGPGARKLEADGDVRDVIELLRLNYDRVGCPSRSAGEDRSVSPEPDDNSSAEGRS